MAVIHLIKITLMPGLGLVPVDADPVGGDVLPVQPHQLLGADSGEDA